MTTLLHQLRFEQKLFWRSREAAVFIFIFPLLLYVLLGSVYGDEIDGIPAVDLLLVGLFGYGAATTAFGGLAIMLVVRREAGVLKRLRATPLSAPVYLLAVLLSTLTTFALQSVALLALGGLGFGYVLPGMVLARMAKRRAHRIRLSLADMLDLLVVSVEAGLGLDQAISRVGAELAFAYPELSEELKLINLELRAGKPRAEALRNLADRTGVDDLSSLVTMLIQTDKFGTSVAQSLRVYSETLRTKRRQRAEEAAAKTGVKMVFPLVFCIFPAIWVVTIGPAAIKFVTVLFPLIHGSK